MLVRRTPRISCEAVPASIRASAGIRRHVHSGNHAAESFVSCIRLFDRLVDSLTLAAILRGGGLEALMLPA